MSLTLTGVKANIGHLEPAAGLAGLAILISTLEQKQATPKHNSA